MYTYTLYGLNVSSDILLFNIPQSDILSQDILIHQGDISLSNIPHAYKDFYHSDNISTVTFQYGALEVLHGNEIIYSVKCGYSHESVTPFIVGWGLAFLLSQRRHTVFHASALSYNNQSFLVSGASGAGKSSTSLDLIQKGCKYLSDDLVIINSIDDLMIIPAYPIQKVCNDASVNLPDNNLYAINNDRGKYSYLNTCDYCNSPKRLTAIIKLKTGNVDYPIVEEINGVEKFIKLLGCRFLAVPFFPFLSDIDKYNCLKISEQIDFYMITRPKDKDTLNEISDTILQLLNKNGENL